MTRREAALRLREWYEAFANFGKGNERTVKEFLEIEDLIHSMDAELTLVKKERDDLRKGMEAATSLLDEYAQTSPRWISVEDEYPYSKLAVLGYGIRSKRYGEYDPFPAVHIVYTRGEDEGWFTFWNNEYVDVTHWMPLPEPPKEE